jgi:hypothetical protein
MQNIWDRTEEYQCKMIECEAETLSESDQNVDQQENCSDSVGSYASFGRIIIVV